MTEPRRTTPPSAAVPRAARPSRRLLLGTALAAWAVAATGAGRARAAAGGPPSAPGGGRSPVPPLSPAALQAAIGDLTDPRSTSAQVAAGGPDGGWYGSSGLTGLTAGRAPRPTDQIRTGSVNKAFATVVVLQLVREGRLGLGTPVRSVLPDLLPESYAPITVAHLLTHTSGLPPESGPGLPDRSTPEGVLAHRFDVVTPRQLVARFTRGELAFRPGDFQQYRGANFVLAAQVVERITGRPYGVEATRRIVRPLGLRDTWFPGDETGLRGPHVRGYLEMSDGRLADITECHVSSSYGDGGMVSSLGDLERFLTALFAGRLLPRAELRRMMTTPPVLMTDGTPARYGMGLQTATVGGVTFWGKTGETFGYNAGIFSTPDRARHVAWSFTPVRRDARQQRMTLRVLAALTGGRWPDDAGGLRGHPRGDQRCGTDTVGGGGAGGP
ncbi:serine hydrolase domain-containing protein [Streptomyces sp. JNUCC 64]